MTIVATAGHVDHGKTTLVAALTGTNTDRLPEEATRGLTIDLGFAHLDGDVELSFVDVPGHVRFVKNMLAGVGATDVALLVVAADDGWMPQTEEHLSILELLGVRHGVVALTKVDLVDQARRAECRSLVARRLAGTFLAAAPVVEVAAPRGEGLDRLRVALEAAAASTEQPLDRGRPRLWIDRAFTRRGVGTVVTGTLTGGSLEVGRRVAIEPDGPECVVRGLQHHGRSRTSVAPGRRVAVNLAHLDLTGTGRGRAVVEPGRWHATGVVDATLTVLADAPAPIARRGSHLVYIGSGEWSAQLRVLGSDAVAPGDGGLVRMRLPVALPLLPGDRYVLRDAGRGVTVGGGEILDVAPVLPASRARPDRRVDRVVAERGWIDADELELLTGERRAPTIGPWVVDPAALRATVEALSTRLSAGEGPGIELAALGARERAVVEAGLLGDDAVVVAGWVRRATVADAVARHPWLDAAARTPFDPPAPEGISAAELRHLQHQGLVVRRDGIVFHHAAVDLAAKIVRTLLATHPDGFTVAQARDAFRSSRRCTLPLLAELDARGVTRRRGDRRTAGPLLGS